MAVEINHKKVEQPRVNIARLFYSVPEESISGLSSGSVYCVDQSEENLSTSTTEGTGKIMEKDLKPRTMKGDMTEPLCQYERNTYSGKTNGRVLDDKLC